MATLQSTSVNSLLNLSAQTITSGKVTTPTIMLDAAGGSASSIQFDSDEMRIELDNNAGLTQQLHIGNDGTNSYVKYKNFSDETVRLEYERGTIVFGAQRVNYFPGIETVSGTVIPVMLRERIVLSNAEQFVSRNFGITFTQVNSVVSSIQTSNNADNDLWSRLTATVTTSQINFSLEWNGNQAAATTPEIVYSVLGYIITPN